MWWWIFAAIGGIILCILLLLCMPVYLLVDINSQSVKKFSIKLSWFFGLVCRDLIPDKTRQNDDSKCHKKPGEKSKISVKLIVRIIKIQGLFKQIKKLLCDIAKRVKVKSLIARLSFGLENPDDTALFFIIAGPLMVLLRAFPYDVTIQPAFEGDISIEAYLNSTIKIKPVLIAPPVIEFLFSYPILHVAWVAIRNKDR